MVEDHNVAAFSGGQAVHKVASDETGASGDENFHCSQYIGSFMC